MFDGKVLWIPHRRFWSPMAESGSKTALGNTRTWLDNVLSRTYLSLRGWVKLAQTADAGFRKPLRTECARLLTALAHNNCRRSHVCSAMNCNFSANFRETTQKPLPFARPTTCSIFSLAETSTSQHFLAKIWKLMNNGISRVKRCANQVEMVRDCEIHPTFVIIPIRLQHWVFHH